MMTEAQIQKAILDILKQADRGGGPNGAHEHHVDGVIRGLLWTLTGVDHGNYLTTDTAKICDLAGIKNRVGEDGRVHYEFTPP